MWAVSFECGEGEEVCNHLSKFNEVSGSPPTFVFGNFPQVKYPGRVCTTHTRLRPFFCFLAATLDLCTLFEFYNLRRLSVPRPVRHWFLLGLGLFELKIYAEIFIGTDPHIYTRKTHPYLGADMDEYSHSQCWMLQLKSFGWISFTWNYI